jgi:hypothetical protein
MRGDRAGLELATDVPSYSDGRYGLGMLEATVRGDGVSLRIRVERYEFPEIETGWSANWLIAEAEIDASMIGCFQARHRLTVLTADLKRFHDELQALERGHASEATLNSMEQEIQLAVRVKSGAVSLDGYLQESGFGPGLHFERVKTDPSFVRVSLEQVDVLIDTFPVRGEIPSAPPPTDAKDFRDRI